MDSRITRKNISTEKRAGVSIDQHLCAFIDSIDANMNDSNN